MPLANPERLLRQARQSWERGTGPSRITTSIQTHASTTLEVAYEFFQDNGATRLRAQLGSTDIALDEAVALVPVAIAKPWGQELWYTGIEARGESRVQGTPGSIPLSHYLALAPQQICAATPPLLLKTLDPSPEPVLGDLYLEAHESKQELYLVTHVDRSAWPDGVGAIRLGVNQNLRRQYADDEAFRAAFLEAVGAYERVRRAIDQGAEHYERTEREARQTMDQFTNLAPLRVGDVVNVPPWVPHSLQHGVRVAELQTPTYERLIIAFAQRVLTQPHWDSQRAIQGLQLDPPPPATRRRTAPGIEQIANCADFTAWRVEVAPGASVQVPGTHPYAVCMCLEGAVDVSGLPRSEAQACFVPRTALPVILLNRSTSPATCLVAVEAS